MNKQAPTSAYPLQWPEGWTRSDRTIRSRFAPSLTISRAYISLSNEVRRFGGVSLIISSNLRVNSDGVTPTSKQRQPDDPGVAVYFQKDGKEWGIGCDTYHQVEDNIYALALTIGNLRAIERYGASQIMEAAFRGFLALPDPNHKEWYQVFKVAPDTVHEVVRRTYQKLAQEFHPDTNPDNEEAYENFLEVQRAWEEYLK